jgi:hypothetical protein
MLPVAPPTSTTVSKGGEVVRGSDRRRFAAMEADHGLAEVRRFFRMERQVIENRFAKRFFEPGLPRLHRIRDLLKGTPKRRVAERNQGAPSRARSAGLERFA